MSSQHTPTSMSSQRITKWQGFCTQYGTESLDWRELISKLASASWDMADYSTVDYITFMTLFRQVSKDRVFTDPFVEILGRLIAHQSERLMDDELWSLLDMQQGGFLTDFLWEACSSTPVNRRLIETFCRRAAHGLWNLNHSIREKKLPEFQLAFIPLIPAAYIVPLFTRLLCLHDVPKEHLKLIHQALTERIRTLSLAEASEVVTCYQALREKSLAWNQFVWSWCEVVANHAPSKPMEVCDGAAAWLDLMRWWCTERIQVPRSLWLILRQQQVNMNQLSRALPRLDGADACELLGTGDVGRLELIRDVLASTAPGSLEPYRVPFEKLMGLFRDSTVDQHALIDAVAWNAPASVNILVVVLGQLRRKDDPKLIHLLLALTAKPTQVAGIKALHLIQLMCDCAGKLVDAPALLPSSELAATALLALANTQQLEQLDIRSASTWRALALALRNKKIAYETTPPSGRYTDAWLQGAIGPKLTELKRRKMLAWLCIRAECADRLAEHIGVVDLRELCLRYAFAPLTVKL